ncbi:MAG TPA: hypothetical protein VK773_11700 [Acidimicrobiales bacterium]|jgi:hypothetical protein|nr:hypothetical protein [Acidimicrobiales bacterium]
MTIDVDRPLEEIFTDDGPAAIDQPPAASPEAGPGSGEGGRRDDEGGGAGGGHTRMARWAEKYDVRNSWQVIAGALLIPLGIVFILLGWYGAAHARVVQQQIPYMVSGSFVGLGCMIVGAMLFWGHWLYRIYDQADLHHEEQQRLLETIAAALLAQRVDGAGAGVGPGRAALGSPGRDAGTGGVAGEPATTNWYATSSGTVYHRDDCAVIAHHPEDLRVLGPDGIVGMRPCQICSPGAG